jgi:hypothetical protein
VGQVLNNLIGSWDITVKEKAAELAGTRILLAGWSWENKRFDIGYFAYEKDGFRFHHQRAKKPHPWHEKERSLVFMGNYEAAYMQELKDVLSTRHPAGKDASDKVMVDFDYEPIEALHSLLTKSRSSKDFLAIGGAVQMIKVYPYGNSLPFAIRMAPASHFLLGRELFEWEKTEYPVLDLTGTKPIVHYPLSYIPLPNGLHGETEVP